MYLTQFIETWELNYLEAVPHKSLEQRLLSECVVAAYMATKKSLGFCGLDSQS